MLVSSIALLATLVPALAGHAQPAHIRHRHLAVRQQEQHTGAHVARANAGHADAHRAAKRTVNKRGQQCRPRGQSKPSLSSTSSQAAGTSAPASSAAPAPSTSSAAWTEPSSAAPAPSAWSAPAEAPAPSAPAPPAPSQGGDDNNQGGDAGSEAHWGVLAVTDNCRTQNNLDYLYQYCNGWMQNKNAHSMGTYFNLAQC